MMIHTCTLGRRELSNREQVRQMQYNTFSNWAGGKIYSVLSFRARRETEISFVLYEVYVRQTDRLLSRILRSGSLRFDMK